MKTPSYTYSLAVSCLLRIVCVADMLLLTQVALSNTNSFVKPTMCHK